VPPPQRAGSVVRSLLTALRHAIARVPPKVRLIVAGSVAFALLVACGAYQAVERVFYSPDRPVTELFAALAARDGARLARVGRCPASPVCRPGALGTGYQPPTRARILEVSTDGDRAVVRVTYQLNGARHEGSVALRRPSGLAPRAWQVTALPGADLDLVSPYGVAARVAGTTVRIAAGSRVPVPPGVYTIAGAPSPLFTAPETTVVVTGEADRQQVSLGAELQPAVGPELTRQVEARINACAAQPDFHPQVAEGACPFRFESVVTSAKDQHWTVVRYPQVAPKLTSSGTVTVQTLAPGQMKVSYAWTTDFSEPREWTPAEDVVDITEISGDVTVEAGAPHWTG
jgi:hypothetical protein